MKLFVYSLMLFYIFKLRFLRNRPITAMIQSVVNRQPLMNVAMHSFLFFYLFFPKDGDAFFSFILFIFSQRWRCILFFFFFFFSPKMAMHSFLIFFFHANLAMHSFILFCLSFHANSIRLLYLFFIVLYACIYLSLTLV